MSVNPWFLLVMSAFALGLLAVVTLLMAGVMRSGPRLPKIAEVVGWVVVVVTTVSAMASAYPLLAGGPVTVTAPVTPMKPYVATGIVFDPPPTATIESGGFDRVTVTTSGLGLGARLTLLAAVLVAAATTIAVSMVIIRLARSLRAGDPFALGSRALMVTGWIVMIGGSLAAVVGDFAGALASHDLFEVSGANLPSDWSSTDEIVTHGWPDSASLVFTIPWWPLGVGLVLALLAAVFRYGEKLRRDAEGLI
jgi:hypothetical protein